MEFARRKKPSGRRPVAREAPRRQSAPRHSARGGHSAAQKPPPADNPLGSSPSPPSGVRTAFPVVGIGASAGGLAAIGAGYQQFAAKPIEPAEVAVAVATLAGRGNGGAG